MKIKLIPLLKMPIPWPILIALIFCALGLLVFHYQKIENYFIFFPDSEWVGHPDLLKMHYEDVLFSTADNVTLNGWLFMQDKNAPVILLCHGNAGNISYWLEHCQLLLKQGLNVFIFDYRGYGKSSGKPSEQGIYRDGLAAFDFLVKGKNIPSQKIIPYGISLGSAVVIEMALQREIHSVITEGAFTSSKEMAKQIPLFFIFAPFVPRHYNNLEKVGRIKVPKLLIHAEEDEVVPFTLGQRLFAAASEPKYFFPIQRAGHNDVYLMGGKAYYEMLARFAMHSKI